MPQLTPVSEKEQVMLREGMVKLSTFTAPAGAGYLTGSLVVALADGWGLVEEDAEDVGFEPPAGPSYPRRPG